MVARIDRLLLTVTVEDGDCWRARTKPNKQGYVRFHKKTGGVRKSIGLHRAFYHKLRGPISAGYEPDHTCRRRWCVNPWHLEPVTHRVNTLRGNTIAASNAAKAVCLRGHQFDVNLPGRRGCRECRRIVAREWYSNGGRDGVLARQRERYRSKRALEWRGDA